MSSNKKSELKIYLHEDIVNEKNLDVLTWWKQNSSSFLFWPKWQEIFLLFQFSTVASESCFKPGKIVLDCFRSSLTPQIVEALICCQDWIRSSNNPVAVEEILDDLENLAIGNLLFNSSFQLVSFILQL